MSARARAAGAHGDPQRLVPGFVRGYERAAVDAYVNASTARSRSWKSAARPTRRSGTPSSSCGSVTSGILQRAQETADEITAKARQEAEASSAREKAEAAARRQRQRRGGRRTGRGGEVVAKASAEAERDPRPLASRGGGDPHPLARGGGRAPAKDRRRGRGTARTSEARKRALQADIQAIGSSSRAARRHPQDGSLLEQMAGEAAARFPPGSPPSRPSKDAGARSRSRS